MITGLSSCFDQLMFFVTVNDFTWAIIWLFEWHANCIIADFILHFFIVIKSSSLGFFHNKFAHTCMQVKKTPGFHSVLWLVFLFWYVQRDKTDAVDIPKAVEFIVASMNFDGGFGCVPGSESHAGQIYCCLGALAITDSLHLINSDLLGWWLCERQLPSGGLNGRPEKLPDEKLRAFILAAQDEEGGGFADRPGDVVSSHL
eukprot:gene15587-17160_t